MQWAYWSIVLEETTNNIYVVDQRTYDGNVSGGQPVPTGNNVSLTVGIQINSTNYVAAPSSPTTGSNTLANAGSGADATDNTFY
ncbi:MAG: hypothetical protein U5L96_19980 [Owenweeksia sp.]|nr:hypothetical protein [Owenweeksia sp.]